MPKNCLILAPPLCGARWLATHLVEQGYHAGKSLPSRLDPSVPSHEDAQLVYLNTKLFEAHKARTEWNKQPEDNGFAFCMDMPTPDRVWPTHVAAPVLLGMQQHQPWVRKDPQLIFTFNDWVTNVWSQCAPEDLPLVVLVSRFPVDWMASVFAGCDEGKWPHIPKDPDYFTGLWLDYMQHMMAIIKQPEFSGRVVASTLDHLCTRAHQAMLNDKLGLRPEAMPGMDVTKIRHNSRRDTIRISKELSHVWSEWQWVVLQTGS